jgi:hypothetical protein
VPALVMIIVVQWFGSEKGEVDGFGESPLDSRRSRQNRQIGGKLRLGV